MPRRAPPRRGRSPCRPARRPPVAPLSGAQRVRPARPPPHSQASPAFATGAHPRPPAPTRAHPRAPHPPSGLRPPPRPLAVWALAPPSPPAVRAATAPLPPHPRVGHRSPPPDSVRGPTPLGSPLDEVLGGGTDAHNEGGGGRGVGSAPAERVPAARGRRWAPVRWSGCPQRGAVRDGEGPGASVGAGPFRGFQALRRRNVRFRDSSVNGVPYVASASPCAWSVARTSSAIRPA